ncbi:MAG: ATP12 family protein [Sphingomicrobium sp.]
MKRFWKDSAVELAEGGWTVALDGRAVRTPARHALVVASRPLAQAIAEEWRSASDEIDPRAMPLTGLANAAIDRVAVDRAGFAAGLARYAQADLACYRSHGPKPLADRQEEQWNALLGWARQRFKVEFATTTAITHVAQPPATIDTLANAVGALDPFRLAGLSPLVTIGGSLVAALAVLERAVSPEDAWAAVTVDEQWQSEKWGEDADAQAALEGRRREFMAAARFLELLER